MRQYLDMTRRRLEESSHKVLLGVKSVDGPKRSGIGAMGGLLVDTIEALGDSSAVLLKQAKAGFQRCGKLGNRETN